MLRLPTVNSRTERKERTRRAIVGAALELCRVRSFSSLSLREVARAAGIAPASFYRHFSGMEQLGLALVDEFGSALRRVLRDGSERLQHCDDVERETVLTFMDALDRHGPLFRLMHEERVSGAPAFRRAVAGEMELLTAGIGAVIDSRRPENGLDAEDIPVVARAVVTLVYDEGVSTLDLSPTERKQAIDRIVAQLKIVTRGARATATRRSEA